MVSQNTALIQVTSYIQEKLSSTGKLDISMIVIL